jgi:hypothetical protein
MNDGPPKKEVMLIVTPDTAFSLYPSCSTYKTVKDDDNYRITNVLYIGTCNLLFIEYNQCHIYFYHENADYYVNLDFNLMPDKEHLSKSIFDQLQEILKEYKRDHYDAIEYYERDFIVHRLLTINKKTNRESSIDLLTGICNYD